MTGSDADLTWSCTGCENEFTSEWDDEFEETIGLPAFHGVLENGDVATICDDCADGADPHSLADLAEAILALRKNPRGQ